MRASNRIADRARQDVRWVRGSKYATGEYFDKYTEQAWEPATERVAQLFADAGVAIPTQDDWRELQGLGAGARHLQPEPAGRPADRFDQLHQPLDVVDPPGGGEDRDPQGRQDRPRLLPGAVHDNDNLDYYQDAYEIGYEKIIDTYAAATQHVDQGLSLTLFFKDTATTRDVNKAQIYAWRKGIKTLYYIRLRQMALEGTEVEGCVSLHAVTVRAASSPMTSFEPEPLMYIAQPNEEVKLKLIDRVSAINWNRVAGREGRRGLGPSRRQLLAAREGAGVQRHPVVEHPHRAREAA